MADKPKDEALEGLSHLRKMLAEPAPLEGVRLVIFRSTLEWVEGRVTEIQELKRARKSDATAPTADES